MPLQIACHTDQFGTLGQITANDVSEIARQGYKSIINNRPDGEAGRYGQSHRVYGHQGETCSACQAVIRRMTQNARSTFYCPRCQR
jgi:uncharacterized protein (TIGR01244 family)